MLSTSRWSSGRTRVVRIHRHNTFGSDSSTLHVGGQLKRKFLQDLKSYLLIPATPKIKCFPEITYLFFELSLGICHFEITKSSVGRQKFAELYELNNVSSSTFAIVGEHRVVTIQDPHLFKGIVAHTDDHDGERKN